MIINSVKHHTNYISLLDDDLVGNGEDRAGVAEGDDSSDSGRSRSDRV